AADRAARNRSPRGGVPLPGSDSWREEGLLDLGGDPQLLLLARAVLRFLADPQNEETLIPPGVDHPEEDRREDRRENEQEDNVAPGSKRVGRDRVVEEDPSRNAPEHRGHGVAGHLERLGWTGS